MNGCIIGLTFVQDFRVISRFNTFSSIALVLLLLDPSILRAADQKIISDAIVHLADPDPRVCESATKTLWQLGRDIRSDELDRSPGFVLLEKSPLLGESSGAMHK